MIYLVSDQIWLPANLPSAQTTSFIQGKQLPVPFSQSSEGCLLDMMKYAVVILAVLIQGKPILVHFQSIVTLSLDELHLLTVRLSELLANVSLLNMQLNISFT